MTIPEALLCQRPVLATAVGGTEDWVRDGATGFISATPTLDNFAAALRRAWDLRHHWQSMGQAGAADATARYRPDDYLQLINP
jgi:glycosyltransferase involved in cell wall biosynthesis